MWPRVACSPRTANPLQHGSPTTRSKSGPHRSDHRPSTRQTSPAMRKTISFDNGTEFAEHHRLHKALGVQTFFCDPHSPWQKGGVENCIGLLRRSLPRKTDLKSITAATLKRFVERLNDTPRKCLDFKTPAEAFSKLKSIVALQT